MLLATRRLPTSLVARRPSSFSGLSLRSLHHSTSAPVNDGSARNSRTSITSTRSSLLQSHALTLQSLQTPSTSRRYTASAVRLGYGEAQAEHPAQAEARSAEHEMEEVDEQDGKAANEGEITKFRQLADRKLVDRVVIDTVTENMGLNTMTEVQSNTILQALEGRDVLAQAKTGTGKTIGFLLPVLQRILALEPDLLRRSQGGRSYAKTNSIRAIIISPTRELADQIAREAIRLTQRLGVVVQRAVGGTSKSADLRKMRIEGCHILVGTPGRLKDVLGDHSSGVTAPKLKALVLDEADRLMDDGFWPEIQEIQELLPDREVQDRQTLMYSATMPNEVIKLVRSVMKPDLYFYASVQGDETPTHELVRQSLVTTPGIENWLPTLLELCQREIQDAEASAGEKRPFKAIVYFNSKAETQLAFQAFLNIRKNPELAYEFLGPARVNQIHSDLSQGQRTAASQAFRETPSAILMSSDVTARGIDFPDVSHVIQVGLPMNQEAYIHRVGRTARAGKDGEAILISTGMMEGVARERLGTLIPRKRDDSLESASVNLATNGRNYDDDANVAESETSAEEMLAAANMSPKASRTFQVIADATARLDPDIFRRAYLTLLSMAQLIKPAPLIGSLNRLAKLQWQLPQAPPVPSKFINFFKLGRAQRYLNISDARPRSNSSSDPFTRRASDRSFSTPYGRQPRSSFDFDESRSGFGGRGESRSGFGGRGESRSDFGGRDEFSSPRKYFDRRGKFNTRR